MLQSYLTVAGEGTHEIVIEKSRFICHLSRVSTEEEAQNFINHIKKQHWNATHNCSAYVIGENDQIQKANDDGEPSGTAGVPMLEVLKKRNLKDTCAVVTRYFGGIKLGAGGLIRAYGKSVSEGLNHVGVVERKLMRVIHTTVNYTWIGKLENELRESPYQIKDIHYADDVEFETYVKESEKQAFTEWITELTNGKSENREGIQVYLEEAFNN
ncbi:MULTISPECIES: YigZ family protein [Bacillus]|uniref:YigZ family protein n=1 Tax=Bacillus TaxID=1386 RepID=UPI0007414D5B|nr:MULTISPECIES: YigZ family protein [Bacillus]KUL17896.1 IMPACT family member yvyE [Bacillus licheniformis LMG 6934]MCI4127243.1 YigZ family protein [Bacillus haynesii]MDE1383170.1 YigZ family protein [Bacillus paralicheniformis]TAI51205.1 YigZ family protein [Bacillus paralicheniformis]TWJ50640.1 IMPACT family member YigZ [Bacillus paralicheniformis]